MKTLSAAVFGVALCLCLTPAASADSAGLVAAYGFEETAGTAAVDSSGAGNPGVFNGATRSASGRFGAAASFDGVNDRIDIADSDTLDLSVGMTLEAWVKPTALGWRTAIMKERPGGIAYALYGSTDTNRPSAEIQAEARAPSAIPTNLWTHLASTYDGATLRLYVNGGEVAARAVSGPITISSGALRIGGNAVWGEYFKGLIDEVRVYNRALTAGEIQTGMNTGIVSPDAPPGAPSLAANVTGGDDVHLSWTAVTDDVAVTNYRIYRNGVLLTTLGAGALSYDVTDETTGTSRYTVRAVDTAGQASPDSNEVTATVAPDTEPPTAPELTATVSGDDVHLTWSAATDDRALARYRVTRRSDDHTVAVVDAPGLDAYDLDLPDGTYDYDVRAIDRTGNTGPASNVASATVGVPDLEPPTAPTLTVAATGRNVHLTWTASSDDKGIREYIVFRDGSLISTVAPDSRELTESNVAYGTYRYTVRAVDTAGKSSPLSNEAGVEIVDPDAQAPTAPVLTAAITDHYDFRLTWTPATDDLGVKEYRVFAGTQLLATVGPATTEWTKVKPSWGGGTWSFRVAAVDNAGHTTSSATVPLTLSPTTTPPVPVFDTPCDGVKPHDFARIQFYAPDVLYGSRTAWAEVDGRTVWGPVTGPASTTQFLWRTWLETEGPHVMKVHVRQADGTEFVSKPCELTVDNLAVTAAIAAPTAGATVSGVVTLDADVFTDGVRDVADWSGWYPAQNPVDFVNFVIDGYPGFNPTATDAPYTATLDTRKMSNGPHTLRADVVWGIDGYPARATSPTITFFVHNELPRPTGVAAAATGDDVLVSWNAVTTSPAITGYRVYRDGTQIATVTDTSYTDPDQPNGTYEYTVVAVNQLGSSDPSDPASATVDADRTAPSVTLDAGCDGRTLSEYVGPIDGTATDDRGGDVTVRVQVDGNTIWGPNTFKGAFHFNWDTRTVSNGTHTMRVIVRDAVGNETIKDCPWTVSNSALSVPITGAADGDTLSGTVALGFQPKADGTAAVAPAFLEVDGARLADAPVGPYSYSWDTTKVANGVHTLTAGMYWRDYPNVMATATIQVTVSNAPPAPSGLVAAYGFEQTSGTSVTDSSGKGSTGTLSGAAWAADGRFGRALSFDGVNDLVTVPDSSLLDLAPGMTLEAWVKPTTTSGWRTVLLKERPGQLAYSLYATGDNGRPLAEIAAGSQRDARGTAALPVGVWTHLAATYDKSTLRLYVNGVQVSSTAVTGTLISSTGALRIGGNAVWGEYFSGLIDEVRIYERALGAAEIAADRDRAV